MASAFLLCPGSETLLNSTAFSQESTSVPFCWRIALVNLSASVEDSDITRSAQWSRYTLAQCGTDEDLGISRHALAYRKQKDPELFHTLKEAKADADARVEKALYQRGIGYTCNDYHISQYNGVVTVTPFRKHYPPDTTACIFWLKNRKPAEWRDRTQLRNDQNETLVAVPPDVLEKLRNRFMESVAPRAKHAPAGNRIALKPIRIENQ